MAESDDDVQIIEEVGIPAPDASSSPIKSDENSLLANQQSGFISPSSSTHNLTGANKTPNASPDEKRSRSSADQDGDSAGISRKAKLQAKIDRLTEIGSPLYSKHNLSAADAAKILLDVPEIDGRKLSTIIPLFCPGKGEWTFVLDLSQIDADLSYDMFGTWGRPSGHKTFYANSARGAVKVSRDKPPTCAYEWYIRLNRYNHPGSGNKVFRKITYCPYKADGTRGNRAIICYKADCDPSDVKQLAHKNAKNQDFAMTAASNYFVSEESEVQIVSKESGPDIEILSEHSGVSPVPIVQEPPESNDYYLSSSSDEADELQFISAKQNNKMSDKRFATLFSNKDNKDAKADSGSDSDDERKGQAFYVGGSEKSGQEVLGPPRKPNDPADMVSKVFKSAREHGAEPIDQSSPQSSSARPSLGTGYRLGDAATPSGRIGGGMPPPRGPPREMVRVVMRMWSDGFSIDDGGLRTYEQKENKEFLQTIMQGQIPVDLVRQHRGAEIDLHMENHQGEPYKPPPMKPFGGEGRRLGGMVDVEPMVEAPVVEPPPAAAAAPEPQEQVPSLEVDPSKPTTAVQVRMANGKRMVVKCNHGHTVNQIRQAIADAHPESMYSEWVLMTTFPNQELTDETLTVADAGLLNAVVVQKLVKPGA